MLRKVLRLVAATAGMAALAWAGDPVVGTWNLNVAKSKFRPGPAPKRETRIYEAQGDGIKVTVKTIEADGRTTTVHVAANYDGKDYPVTGSSDYDAIELKRVNDQVAEAILMHGQRLVANAKREISADGKTMTITYKTPSDADHPVNNQAVYDKQ
jgi:formylglycine-generating enzyme required for sulfatase activity